MDPGNEQAYSKCADIDVFLYLLFVKFDFSRRF